MSSQMWSDSVSMLGGLLRGLSVRDLEGVEVGLDDGFGQWCDLVMKLRESRGTVFMIGNGASASMASHCSADLAKNAGVHTEVFSDLSLITAISNDIGYENVFAEPLRRRGEAGSMLVAISSSGSSPNVLAAVEVAKELGLTVVTLSGFSPGNQLRKTGDLNFYVSAATYGHAESCHAVILHHWIDLVVGEASGRGARE